MKNIQGASLAYIIRKIPSPSYIVIDREQEIIQNDPLQCNMFSRDTKKVLEILKELIVDTDSETCMKGEIFGQKQCWNCIIIMMANHSVNA